MPLNEEQEKAAAHVDGPCLVIACPGSGKTFTLTERVSRLADIGVHPSRIFNVTFTKKAAGEMTERINKKLNVGKFPGFTGTFHSFCLTMIKRYVHAVGYEYDFSICGASGQKRIIKSLLEERFEAVQRDDMATVVDGVNQSREELISPTDRETLLAQFYNGNEVLYDVARDYLAHLRIHNMIDFSGLLSETVWMFRKHPHILAEVQARYSHIQVDEVQDTNNAQFILAGQLSAVHRNILMVGDLDQSIYRFRGAQPENITNYIRHNPDCKMINLSKNYRSTPCIIDAAASVIKENPDRIITRFDATRPETGKVKIKINHNQYQEAEWIVRAVQQLLTKGYAYKDIAVLYRLKSMAKAVEDRFKDAQIPYRIVGGKSFYERMEILDVLAMLTILSNPRDTTAFGRMIDLLWGFGIKTQRKVAKAVREDKSMTFMLACAAIRGRTKSKKLLTSLQKLERLSHIDITAQPITETINLAVQAMDYREYLLAFSEPEERYLNIRALIDQSTDMVDMPLSEYLQQISLMTSLDDKQDDDDCVMLMTIHASKGLEFPVVIFIGWEDGILPFALSSQEIRGTEEERRVAYVGMTRAKDRLYLSYCTLSRRRDRHGNYYPVAPSQFLYETGIFNKEELLAVQPPSQDRRQWSGSRF